MCGFPKPGQGADGKGKEKDSTSDPASVSAAIYTANLTAIVAVLTAAITAILSILTSGKTLRVSSRNDLIAAFASDAGFRNAIGAIAQASHSKTVQDSLDNPGIFVLLALKEDGAVLKEQMLNAAKSLNAANNSEQADILRECLRKLLSA